MRAAYDGWHGLMLLIPRKLPMPDAGGRTSSVKTWLRLYTDAKLDIYFFLCGASVDTLGSHAWSCKRNAGCIQRHAFIND